MPKEMPSLATNSERIYRDLTRSLMARLVNPIRAFAPYESAANVRSAVEDAQANEGPRGFYPTSASMALIPNTTCRGEETCEAIDDEKKRIRAASDAATYLVNSRVYWQQAKNTVETIQPINYYYGGISFLEFITSCLVYRRPSGGSHGLDVIYPSEDKVDKNWPGKCSVVMKNGGDFPYFVDALTAGGFPSLFSGYRFYRPDTAAPWEIVTNPSPLAKKKISLQLLCNFSLAKHTANNVGADSFWTGPNFDGDTSSLS